MNILIKLVTTLLLYSFYPAPVALSVLSDSSTLKTTEWHNPAKITKGYSEFKIAFISFLVFFIFNLCIMVYCLSIIFENHSFSWWLAIIPILNLIILLRIMERSVWWMILFFLPVLTYTIETMIGDYRFNSELHVIAGYLNLSFQLLLLNFLRGSLGKPWYYFVGFVLLPVVFLPLATFSSSTNSGRPFTC